MKSAIIHISDLHVSLFELRNGEKNDKIQSYLTTNNETSESDYYVTLFIEKIKNDYNSDYTLYLLITGDIADTSDTLEYEFAEKFIKRILSELNIPNSNLLLIPGDHDISRLKLNIELDQRPNKESHLLNDIKYSNFAPFYRNLKGEDFNLGNCIIDYLQIDNSLVLIGCNTNYKINNSGGNGFIEPQSFKNEILSLNQTLNDAAPLQTILCFHHNITAGYENTATGQWEKENRQHLIPEFNSNNVKLILTGNEHICASRNLGESIVTSDAGSFAAKKHQATFKVYEIISQNGLSLINKCYCLQVTNGIDSKYFWTQINSEDWQQRPVFELVIPNEEKIESTLELPTSPSEETGEKSPKKAKDHNEFSAVYYSNNQISESLYQILKKEKIFHSGHFHWSETSRAHNWIDVSKLLEKVDNLYFAQNAIIDVIEQFNLNNNCDLIIGLGYEGNIISSKAAIKYSIPYTSLPYSYRYNDHHEYEKKLNFTNSESLYKNILIITDVVNDGRTIRKLIGKREKEFFDKTDKIIVISLFYTGHEAIDIGILNHCNLPEEYDFENDHTINNIEFYTVKTMRVEKCPYGKDFRQECLIYKDELSCVHFFYDEAMAINKLPIGDN